MMNSVFLSISITFLSSLGFVFYLEEKEKVLPFIFGATLLLINNNLVCFIGFAILRFLESSKSRITASLISVVFLAKMLALYGVSYVILLILDWNGFWFAVGCFVGLISSVVSISIGSYLSLGKLQQSH